MVFPDPWYTHRGNVRHELQIMLFNDFDLAFYEMQRALADARPMSNTRRLPTFGDGTSPADIINKRSSLREQHATIASINAMEDTPLKVYRGGDREEIQMRFSEYNSDRKRYVLQPEKLSSEKNFVMKPTQMPSGAFKGRLALVLIPVPDDHFRFFDLPCEIRRMIFEELFTKHGHQLSIKCPNKYQTKAAWVEGGLEIHPHSDHAHLPKKILLVSHQIRQEASVALCGRNTFQFKSTVVLKRFLGDIGTARTFIGSIELWVEGAQYGRPSALGAAKLLRDAKKLRRFHLDLHLMLDTEHVGSTSEDFKPLLKSLYEREEDVAQVFNIMTFGQERLGYFCAMHSANSKRKRCQNCRNVRYAKCRQFSIDLRCDTEPYLLYQTTVQSRLVCQ